MKAKVTVNSKFVVCIGLTLFVANVSGCAALKCLPNNNMCSSNCEHQCSKCQEELHDEGDVFPEPMDPMGPEFLGKAAQATHWEDLSSVQEQLVSLTEADDALQEQLALLDTNAEKQRQERKGTDEQLALLTAQVSAVRAELNSHQDDVKQMESSLLRQRTEHEHVLASFEQQLIEVLRE